MEEQITTDPTGGKKADSDKVRFELLIPEFIEAFARVMTFGAKKYGDWNYLLLQRERVIGAVHRHINAYQQGEHNDPETGESHLIHATCCMMMLWGINNEFRGKKGKWDLGIHMHEHPKSDSSAGVTQNASTDINTENVKVKGDLVAIRYPGENFEEIKPYLPCEFRETSMGVIAIVCESDSIKNLVPSGAGCSGTLSASNNNWMVFHKKIWKSFCIKCPEFYFNSKLKHLFE